MPPKAIRTTSIPREPQDELTPLVPTIVVASYKGGVGKTAITVALAERLAYAGARVLLLTCDSQEDARARLGVKPAEGLVAYRNYGQGCMTITGLRGSKAIDALYRNGPERTGYGSPDLAILDTPPEIEGGRLPGVLLIAPVDGKDALRNLVAILRRTPANSAIVLVKMGRSDADTWGENVEHVEQALGRSVMYLGSPLPRTKAIHRAHNEGQSVWAVRRTEGTASFLEGIDALAQVMWRRLHETKPWPTALPAATALAPYVQGWDDED